MNSISGKEFEIGDPNVITQFLRGELYVLIDSVLSISATFKLTSDMKLVSDLFETFLAFFNKYLEALPKALPQVNLA
jgi:hypothetical protein